MRDQRSRVRYFAALVVVVMVGLAAREARDRWPSVATAYVGDTLWPVAFFLLFACVWPGASKARLAVAVLAVTVGIELSQLYHAPWIDAVRTTRVGRLLLGDTFLVSDLVCLGVGVALAVGLDGVLGRHPALRPRGASGPA